MISLALALNSEISRMHTHRIILSSAILALCLLSTASSAQAPQAGQRPNIVLILADDMGYGDLKSYNPDSKIPTPHMDRLAAEGVRFTDAHSPSGVCTPTRYGLLTGRYAWRTPLKRGVLNGYSPMLIEPGRLTLPAMLKARGYRTAAIGKWHLGLGEAEPADFSKRFTAGPVSAGFDYFYGIPASLDMAPYLYVENDRATAAPTGHIAASAMRRHGGGGFWREGPIAPGFSHEGVLPELAEKAVSFIGKQTPGGPFFLYLPLAAPHTPWMPTPAFRGRSGAGPYGDFVVQVDVVVGQVLAALEGAKVSGDTLVILTSDNGAHWLPADIEKYGHRANGPLRGQKADIWEGGHRVPFIVRWPGVVRAGGVRDDLAGLVDVFATAADITGAELPKTAGEDSVSLLPALRGEQRASPIRQTLVHHSSDGTFAIRDGRWKLAMALGSRGFSEPRGATPAPGEPKGQLYDLEADPGEQRNLWLEKPEIVQRLTEVLEAIQDR